MTFEDIQAIVDDNDIVDVISDCIPLWRSGKLWKGHCPWHAEYGAKASFFVNPKLKLYHCFQCHKGGNVIQFLMDYDKISFNNAVDKLEWLQNEH